MPPQTRDRAGAIEDASGGAKARRAQSLYCAIGIAKRRNKAIAPYASACRSRRRHGVALPFAFIRR